MAATSALPLFCYWRRLYLTFEKKFTPNRPWLAGLVTSCRPTTSRTGSDTRNWSRPSITSVALCPFGPSPPFSDNGGGADEDARHITAYTARLQRLRGAPASRCSKRRQSIQNGSNAEKAPRDPLFAQLHALTDDEDYDYVQIGANNDDHVLIGWWLHAVAL